MRIVILLLFLSFNCCFAQYWDGQEIEATDLSPWVPTSKEAYAGVYHFGESEGESNFLLFFSGQEVVAQISMGVWEEERWKSHYITLTNVTINKQGKFSSDQHTGQFVHYQTSSGKWIKGLRIDNPWSDWIENSSFEIGHKITSALEKFYAGNYAQASLRKLALEALQQYSPKELKIMRNEIFARYGYIFKTGGAMANYFAAQDWYSPQHTDVSSFLTSVELHNIQLIQQLE